MSDDPILVDYTADEANDTYNELKGLYVELDNDPLLFGPKRLNGKVAAVRRALDRCERIFLDLAQRLHAVRRALRIAAADYDLAKKDLLANDPATRAGRAVSERDAIATGKLLPEVRKVQYLESQVEDLEAVLVVVKVRRTDLKDTESRLRDQVRLCAEEIGLGSRWGSRVPNAPELPAAVVVPDILKAVEEILAHAGAEGEIHLAAVESVAQVTEERPRVETKVETEPLMENDQSVDLAATLPQTAEGSAVDAFLDEADVAFAPMSAAKPGLDALDPGILESILESFEANT